MTVVRLLFPPAEAPWALPLLAPPPLLVLLTLFCPALSGREGGAAVLVDSPALALSRPELLGLLLGSDRFWFWPPELEDPEGERGRGCGEAPMFATCKGSAVGPTDGTRTGPGCEALTWPS